MGIVLKDRTKMTAENTRKEGGWENIQGKLAEDDGLAIALVEGDGLSNLALSNNNSICDVLTSSKEFAPECQRFCGSVFSKIQETGQSAKYKCHAGLECVAVRVKTKGDKPLVAITGRAFTKASDYREATDRAASGDWKDFPPGKFFENILITSSTKDIEKLGRNLVERGDREQQILQDFVTADRGATMSVETDAPDNETSVDESDRISSDAQAITKQQSQDAAEYAAWRLFFGAIHDLSYAEACASILKFIEERYEISSLAWLENVDNHLIKVLAIGALEEQKVRISMPTNDKRLLRVFRKQTSVELREQNEKGGQSQTIRLYPIAIAGKIRSALVLGEKSGDKRIRVHVSRFCQLVAYELEIIKLRQELSRQSSLDNALEKINKSLSNIDSNDFWRDIMQTAADLVKAGRGSLLVYDEKDENLAVRAAIGRRTDFMESKESEVGSRIAKKVWKNGKPLVVADISKIGLSPAPAEWEYRTGSFISYPLSIGKRRVGVLNVTDKVDGGVFDKTDLMLLKAIVPQLSVAIDRAILKSKAGEFEQLSVTDPLTGLLNRRYLEERLTEEIKRSDRHGYPMSFLMMDVDDFKSYNDTFTHPEGDKALQIVGQCLRESLRDADVAARYGGEEFSILLPQTNLEEARTIAERLRERIATTRFPNRQVTASIGITGASSTRDTAAEIISAADKALFAAKRNGRNNVQIYEYVRKNLEIK